MNKESYFSVHKLFTVLLDLKHARVQIHVHGGPPALLV